MYLELPATPALLTAEQRDVLYGQDPLPRLACEFEHNEYTASFGEAVKERVRCGESQDFIRSRTGSGSSSWCSCVQQQSIARASPDQVLAAAAGAGRRAARASAMEAAASGTGCRAARGRAATFCSGGHGGLGLSAGEESGGAYEDSAVLAATTSSALLTAARSISQAMDARDGQRAVDAGNPVPKSLDDCVKKRRRP